MRSRPVACVLILAPILQDISGQCGAGRFDVVTQGQVCSCSAAARVGVGVRVVVVGVGENASFILISLATIRLPARGAITQILYLDAKTNASWDAGPSPRAASLPCFVVPVHRHVQVMADGIVAPAGGTVWRDRSPFLRHATLL